MTEALLEKSFFVIKPEGIKNTKSIKDIILKSGLKIIGSKKTLLTKEVIKIIYPDIESDLLRAHLKFMTKEFCEAGIVEGQNAISVLVEIAGKKTNPNLCANGTIRNLFGIKELFKVGNSSYYKNAFHRSQNKEEAKKEVALFYKI